MEKGQGYEHSERCNYRVDGPGKINAKSVFMLTQD